MSPSISLTMTRCQRLAIKTIPRRSISTQCLRASSSVHHNVRRRRPITTTHSSRRSQSTDSTLTSSSEASSTNPKIIGIVDQISQLTLLETADLVSTLKTKLKIPELSFASPLSSSGQGSSQQTQSTQAAVEEDEPAPAVQEKTMFTLKLQSFEATAKPKIIKEVKSMLGLSLVDSKKFVESAPKTLKEGVAKDEAEKIVETLKALGAVVAME